MMDVFPGEQRRVNFPLVDLHCGTSCFISCDIPLFPTLEQSTSKILNLMEGKKANIFPLIL